MTFLQKHPIPVAVSNPTEERLQALQALFPEAFSEGQVDFERLRAALGDLADERPERYSFTWAGKRDALRLLQTPTRAALLPCREESLDFETTRNLFIESDNLEALKLLYKSYFGRVKLIYIDPPYNTGNDFIYPDNFADPLGTYLQLTGQQDAAGNLLTSNPESSGRYHSAWLSMIYPRLFLARQLLREDGVIFVSIDDHEVHNLRMAMNEIFGEENFVASIVWQKKYAVSSDAKGIPPMHDYIVVYQKAASFVPNLLPRTEKQDAVYQNPDNDPRGPWRPDNLTRSEYRERDFYPVVSPKTGKVFYPPKGASWRHPKEVVEQMIADNRIWFGKDGNNRPVPKRFLSEVRQGIVASAWWPHTETGHNDESKKELQALFDGESPFDTPKPTRLLRRMLEIATNPITDDVVLDFFAGSATTAQAVLELNREDGGSRRFILVQLPEPTGSAQFPTIAEIGKERIRRVVARMKKARAGQLPLETRPTPEDLGFRVYKLAASNFQPWVGVSQAELAAYAGQMALFHDPLVEGWTNEGVLAELTLKHGLDLCSRVEALTAAEKLYRVTDAERGQRLYVSLAQKVDAEIVPALGLGREDVFICRDAALDDAAAANLALQCRLETI